jgi:poly(3-hydroxybutyrate) depolymerase
MRTSPSILICILFAITNLIAGGKVRKTIIVDGREREFFLHIPSSYTGNTSVPLVFMLHGTGGDGERMYEDSGWAELSEKEGFIAMFPSSLKYKINDGGELKNITKWNITPDADFVFQAGEIGYDDIKFLRRIIDITKSELAIDAQRIYLNGFSNGGAMAAKCSIEMSDVLAAVCGSASSFFLDTVYVPKRRIPYLFQLGNRDYGPGNVGPDFPQAPLRLFDSLISTPNLSYLNGRHHRIANNVVRNFGLQAKHTGIVGDTNRVVLATYLPLDANDNHEFKFVFVKDLGHSYPDWAPAEHWKWLMQFTLNGVSSSVADLDGIDRWIFYPNPSNDIIYFDRMVHYTILEMNGRTLLKGYDSSVSIDQLSKGTYIVSDGQINQKLVVIED